MNLPLFWSILGVVFIIMELFTATTYGLGLGIASFLTAVYVSVFGVTGFEVWQFIIFLVVTTVCALTFPKILNVKTPKAPVGMDAMVGRKGPVLKNGETWKIKLDGVEYKIEAEDELTEGTKMEVTGHAGGVLHVK